MLLKILNHFSVITSAPFMWFGLVSISAHVCKLRDCIVSKHQGAFVNGPLYFNILITFHISRCDPMRPATTLALCMLP